MKRLDRSEAKYYKWGLFYYNPDNEDLMVQNLLGTGTGFNWAHKRAYVFLLFLILFIPLVIFVPLYFLGYI